MTKMTGLIPGLPSGQGALPMPASSKNVPSKVPTDKVCAENMMQSVTKSTDKISAGSMMQQATKPFDQISQESFMKFANKSVNQLSQGLVGSQPTKNDSAFDCQTEKVIISNFPQTPSLNQKQVSNKSKLFFLLIWIRILNPIHVIGYV